MASLPVVLLCIAVIVPSGWPSPRSSVLALVLGVIALIAELGLAFGWVHS